MKNCRNCGIAYAPSARDLKKSDYQCAPCRKKWLHDYRKDRKASGRPVITGNMPKEWYSEYSKKYFSVLENRERRNRNAKNYRTIPQVAVKQAARLEVRRSLERQEIDKFPCVMCGSLNVEAHHVDYHRPLDVVWVCREHHRAIHAKSRGER
jgi:hypothetical protein